MKTLFSVIVLGLLLGGCVAAPHTLDEPAAVPPGATGWNERALADAVDYAGANLSTGFLIIQDGRIIVDRSWPLPDDPASKTFRETLVHGTTQRGELLEDVASQQKSFIALLVGIAADKGLLDVSRPVSAYLGEGWSKATPQQEYAITVLNLLEMNSGLTEQFTFAAPAGTTFFYNTPVYAVLKPVLERAAGQTLDAITRDWLTFPLGMTDTAWRRRPGALASNSKNATGLVTTARDVAKMGQLVLDRGKAPDGKRVISERELDLMFQPSSTNPAYGRLWWLNSGTWFTQAGGSLDPDGSKGRREGALIPAAPKDLVAAQGLEERKLHIVPSMRLVLVRTGQKTGPDQTFNREIWERLTQALPQDKSKEERDASSKLSGTLQ